MSTIVAVSVTKAKERGDQSAFVQSLHQFQAALETYKVNKCN